MVGQEGEPRVNKVERVSLEDLSGATHLVLGSLRAAGIIGAVRDKEGQWFTIMPMSEEEIMALALDANPDLLSGDIAADERALAEGDVLPFEGAPGRNQS